MFCMSLKQFIRILAKRGGLDWSLRSRDLELQSSRSNTFSSAKALFAALNQPLMFFDPVDHPLPSKALPKLPSKGRHARDYCIAQI